MSSVVRPLSSFVSIEELQAHLQRHIIAVSDDNAAVRRRALQQLSDALAAGDTSPATEELLRQLFPAIMKPLLKRFSDPTEKCRELAIQLVRCLSCLVIVAVLACVC